MTTLADTASPTVRARRVPPWVVLVLFTVSGATGLMLEVVWSRMLITLLGATTWGVMTTLVAFLGGLGLGGLLWGPRASRSARPLRLYGMLEVGVGLYCLAVPLLFQGIGSGYIAATRLLGDEPSLGLAARIISAMLALAPPTILMGGTLPALTRVVTTARGGAEAGRSAGVLYASNTMGAVLGCFVTGFVLIAWIGVPASNGLAAGLALTVGLLALGLDRRSGRESGSEVVIESQAEAEGEPEVEGGLADRSVGARAGQIALGVATLSGFCGLAYEVLWTRSLLALMTDNTTYAFTLMLTSYLAGHAVGSALASRRRGAAGPGAEVSTTWRRLGMVQTLAGLAALASLPLLIAPTDRMFRLKMDPDATFWTSIVPYQLGISLAVLAPPAALLGASFPLAARLYVGRGRPVGSSAGRLYGLNTLGAISGAVVVVALLIPMLGTQGALVALGGMQAIVGIVAFLVGGGRQGVGSRLLTAVVLGMLLAGGVAANRWIRLSTVYETKEPGVLLAITEGQGATVTTHRLRTGDRVININGTNVAGTEPMLRTTQKLQAHLPMLLHPGPEAILQVGFGSGGTCYSASLHEGLASIEVVELTPEVIAMSAEFFRDINRGVLDDPRVEVRIADARSHVAVTDRTYDVILSDSIHPRFRGNATLYTRDYLQRCADRLRPGGIVSTWLPMYGLSTEDVRSILGSFHAVFPHVQLWYPNIEPNENTVVIASMEPIRVDWRRFSGGFDDPAIAADLIEVGYRSPMQLLDSFVLGDRAVSQLAEGARINSDDHPTLEFFAPYAVHRFEEWRDNFDLIREAREPILPYVTGADDEVLAELARWYEGTGWKLAAHADEILRLPAEAAEDYARCVAINPADTVARRRLEAMRARYLQGARPGFGP